MAHPHRIKGPAGLIEQLHPVHQHRNPFAPLGCLLGDVAEHDCLAAAGGQHEQHGPVSLLEGKTDPLHGLQLVGTQGDGHGTPTALRQILGLAKTTARLLR